MTKNSPSRMRFWLSSIVRPDRSGGMPNNENRISGAGSRSRVPRRSQSLFSQARRKPSSTPPKAITKTVGEKPRMVKGGLWGRSQPQELLCRTPRTINARPAADSTVPRTSRRSPLLGARRVLGDPVEQGQHGEYEDDLAGEHQPPGGVRGQPAAQQRADGDARAGQAADDTVGHGPVTALVGAADQGGERGQYQGGTQPLDDRPAHREYPQDRCHGGESRADAVDGQADAEHAATAEHVAELAPGDHECRHHEGVEGDDALDRGDLGVEVLHQLADRHVHHRGVEHHQELCRAQHRQRPPPSHRAPPPPVVSPWLAPLFARWSEMSEGVLMVACPARVRGPAAPGRGVLARR